MFKAINSHLEITRSQWDELKCDISDARKIVQGSLVPHSESEVYTLKEKIATFVRAIRSLHPNQNASQNPVVSLAIFKALKKTADEGDFVLRQLSEKYPSQLQKLFRNVSRFLM